MSMKEKLPIIMGGLNSPEEILSQNEIVLLEGFIEECRQALMNRFKDKGVKNKLGYLHKFSHEVADCIEYLDPFLYDRIDISADTTSSLSWEKYADISDSLTCSLPEKKENVFESSKISKKAQLFLSIIDIRFQILFASLSGYSGAQIITDLCNDYIKYLIVRHDIDIANMPNSLKIQTPPSVIKGIRQLNQYQGYLSDISLEHHPGRYEALADLKRGLEDQEVHPAIVRRRVNAEFQTQDRALSKLEATMFSDTQKAIEVLDDLDVHLMLAMLFEFEDSTFSFEKSLTSS